MKTHAIQPCPPLLIERICAPIREWGLTSPEAGALAGIDPAIWAALCRPGTALAFAVKKAEAHFMLTILKLIFGPQIAGQPKVNRAQLRAMLERRFPGIWGRGALDPLSRNATHEAGLLMNEWLKEGPLEWPAIEDDLPAAAEEEPVPAATAPSKPAHPAHPAPAHPARTNAFAPRPTGAHASAG